MFLFQVWMRSISSSPCIASSIAIALEKKRDVVIHAFSTDWRLKCAFVQRTIASAIEKHGIEDPVMRREMNDLVAASLVVADCKGEERVTLHCLGDGRESYAEAVPAVGEVRAYARLNAEQSGASVLRLSRVSYGSTEASSSTVAGRAVQPLLAVQGLASLVFEGGAVVMEQSAQKPLAFEEQQALQGARSHVFVHCSLFLLLSDRLLSFGPPREGETATHFVERLAAGEKVHISRVWTAFHCRCVLPQNAKSFASVGEVLKCHFCAKNHVVT
jgi:hypothetical protein